MLADKLQELSEEIRLVGVGDESLEFQARRVLLLLVETEDLTSKTRPIAADPGLCPNCGTRTPNRTTPYCSSECKEMAAFVRQFRAALANGAVLTPERQLALGQKLWFVIGGGLPFRESLIPGSTLNQVRKRSGGRCEICGEPATRIENFGSG